MYLSSISDFLRYAHIFFEKTLDKSEKICIIISAADESGIICESGGTGRRARLRGVWITPYGFKSRFSHQKSEFSNSDFSLLKIPENPVIMRVSGLFLLFLKSI